MVSGSARGAARVTGWVTRNRRPLVNARPSADFEAAGLAPTATSLKSAIVSPLIINDRLIGTLAVYQEAEDAYTDDHRRLLDRVCEQASAVITVRSKLMAVLGSVPTTSSANSWYSFRSPVLP